MGPWTARNTIAYPNVSSGTRRGSVRVWKQTAQKDRRKKAKADIPVGPTLSRGNMRMWRSFRLKSKGFALMDAFLAGVQGWEPIYMRSDRSSKGCHVAIRANVQPKIMRIRTALVLFLGCSITNPLPQWRSLRSPTVCVKKLSDPLPARPVDCY